MTNRKPLDEARKLLRIAVDGDKKAARSAYELLAKLRESKPNHALIEAYYGSSLALLARDATKLMEKADKAQEALDALDRAVAMDPNHKEIRLLRANVCLRLPESFFQRSKTAIEDLTFLLERDNNNPGALKQELRSDVERNLRLAYQNAGKAEEGKAALQRLQSAKPKRA